MLKISKRLLDCGVVMAGLGWIISHILFIYLNDRYSLLDVSYNYKTSVYVSMLFYIISLFLFDILLFTVRNSEANSLMRVYWAILSVLMIIWRFFFMEKFMTTESGGSLLVGLFACLFTPLIPMLPVGYLFFFKILGMEWKTMISWNSNIVLILCIAHFFYFRWLSHHQAQ